MIDRPLGTLVFNVLASDLSLIGSLADLLLSD